MNTTSRPLDQPIPRLHFVETTGQLHLDLVFSHNVWHVGPFCIGETLSHLLQTLRAYPYQVPNVRVHEKEKVIVQLKDYEMEFIMDTSQRMTAMVISSLSKVLVTLQGKPMETLAQVYAALGPTSAGIWDTNDQYHLAYQGLDLFFQVPPHLNGQTVPLLVNGISPACTKIKIFGNVTLEHVALKLDIKKRAIKWADQILSIGDMPQDIVRVLGSPDAQYAPEEADLLISDPTCVLSKPFFFNYFARGLDIMLDGDSHQILAFVFHTNLPFHVPFAQYDSCLFSVIGYSQPITDWTQFITETMGLKPISPVWTVHRGTQITGIRMTRYVAYENIILDTCSDGALVRLIVQ